MSNCQIPFDPSKLARTSDPVTSHDAAKACRDMREQHHETILGVMRQTSYAGAVRDWIADEIAEWCDLDRHQIGRRLGELDRAGLVRRTDNKRPTPSGRMACAYEVVRK